MNRKPIFRRGGCAAVAWLLCAVMMLGVLAMPAGATSDTKSKEPQIDALQIENRAVNNGVALTYGGKRLNVSAQNIDGYLFVPLGAFANTFAKATYRYDTATKYATLTAPGLVLTAGVGGTFLTANDRPLYGVASNRMINGTVWVPLNPLAKAMSLTVKFDRATSSAAISGSYRALTPAQEFYREDEVYWLSRIISAESRGEPLRGQMAVGNVILNRTRSSYFPNTIWGVIFEKGQFSPVKNGSIYNAPSWSAVIAAKMCLEGYSISNSVLFFCNVESASSHWIENNRLFAFKIGNHSFFN